MHTQSSLTNINTNNNTSICLNPSHTCNINHLSQTCNAYHILSNHIISNKSPLNPRIHIKLR